MPIGSMTPENPTQLEKVKLFLQFYVNDAESADEIRNWRFQNLSPSMLKKHASNLEALEWIVNETPKDISPTEIVKWDANYVIDTGTDEIANPVQAETEARFWLLEFAEFVRDILSDQAPPRRYPVIVEGPRAFFFPQGD